MSSPYQSPQSQNSVAPGAAPVYTSVQPHRGVMILVLGILALVLGLSTGCVGLVLGPIAWVMGNNDLAEMAAFRMDRTGEGMTQAGRICGMVATIVCLVGLLVSLAIVCVYFAFIAVIIGAAAQQGG
ncbi:MAG: hypothetical protein HYS13_11140 [Planctomycetia bacterium]|nr:hypothetical protein [Planctomycetia bacterium]